MTHLRRRIHDGTSVHQELRGDEWVEIAPSAALGGTVFDPRWDAAHIRDGRRTGPAEPMPFQPASFRDFMLYEKHNIDATRGYIRRFLPAVVPIATTYEAVTRRTFPRFKPAKLFYRQPMYYMGNHLAFVPSGTDIAAPSYSTALDYELELGFVLSKPLFDASADEALDAIGAFVLVNDFSARDVQRAEMDSGFGLQKAKHFVSSMSSTAVTADEVLDRIDSLTGRVQIDGEVVAEVSSAGMQWSLAEVLAHTSQSEPLFPGELFATGTLPGGSGMENGRWPLPGQTLRLTLDGIGTAEHRIIGK